MCAHPAPEPENPAPLEPINRLLSPRLVYLINLDRKLERKCCSEMAIRGPPESSVALNRQVPNANELASRIVLRTKTVCTVAPSQSRTALTESVLCRTPYPLGHAGTLVLLTEILSPFDECRALL